MMNRNSKSMNFGENNNSTFNKTADSNMVSNTVTINSNQNNNDFSSKIKLDSKEIGDNKILTKKMTFIDKKEESNLNGTTNVISNSSNDIVLLTKEEIEQRKQALNKKFMDEKAKKIVENSGVEKFPSIADRIKLVEKHFGGNKDESNNIENGIKSEEASTYDKPIIKKKLKSRPNINFE